MIKISEFLTETAFKTYIGTKGLLLSIRMKLAIVVAAGVLIKDGGLGFKIRWYLWTGAEQQGSAWMVVAMRVLGEDGGLSFLRK